MSLFKKIILILFIIFIGGGFAFWVFHKKNQTKYSVVAVKKGNLIQTVSETGTVKSREELELNFLQTGKIAKILVDVGDRVKVGQILAELDHSSLDIREREAKANLEVAQANLKKLLAGASTHDIAVAQANVEQAKASYEAALNELEKTKRLVKENIDQAQKTLDDLLSKNDSDLTPQEQAVETARVNLENTKAIYQRAIDNNREVALTSIESQLSSANTALDYIDRVLSDDDAEGLLSAKNSSFLIKLKESYNQSLIAVENAKKSLEDAKSKEAPIDKVSSALDIALIALRSVFDSLNYCYTVLENSSTGASFTETDLNNYKSNINSQITIISSGISSLESVSHNLADAILNYNTNVSAAENNLNQAEANLEDAITKAKNALSAAKVSGDQKIAMAQAKVDSTLEAWNVAKAQLAKIKAPARQEDVDLAKAKVQQAQAALNVIKNQIDDSIIKAPIDGVITKVNYEVGEQSLLSKPAILMLGENNLEIEVDISEADIAKLKIGDKCEITLDAFGEDVKFLGNVRFIEPAATVIQDVIYYKTKIDFIDFKGYDKEIKPGMTANVTIITARKNNVLILPIRSIIEKEDGSKIVRVLNRGVIQEKKVKLGLYGDDGLVEIQDGLNEGEKVILRIIQN